jgi:uncharacterized protein
MTINVLSIDGGGIRGVGSAHMLEALEAHLGKRLDEAFQLFVGTSTGAILAGGIAAKAMTASELKTLYRSDGRQMFVRSILGSLEHGLFRARYRTDRKGATIKRILGDMKLGTIPRNFMATFYDMGSKSGPVFANGGPDYRGKSPPDNNFRDWPLWSVINASSSAPMYFDPARFRVGGRAVVGVDGGIFANNPTMCAFVEARNLFRTDDIVVVSVGTGLSRLSFPHRKRWGMLQWASPFDHVPLLEAMFDGQSSTVSHQMAQVLNQRLFRFEFNLDHYPHITMDDASDGNQNAIIAATDAYLAMPDTRQKLADAAAAVTAGIAMPAPKLSLPPDTQRPDREPEDDAG